MTRYLYESQIPFVFTSNNSNSTFCRTPQGPDLFNGQGKHDKFLWFARSLKMCSKFCHAHICSHIFLINRTPTRKRKIAQPNFEREHRFLLRTKTMVRNSSLKSAIRSSYRQPRRVTFAKGFNDLQVGIQVKWIPSNDVDDKKRMHCSREEKKIMRRMA